MNVVITEAIRRGLQLFKSKNDQAAKNKFSRDGSAAIAQAPYR